MPLSNSNVFVRTDTETPISAYPEDDSFGQLLGRRISNGCPEWLANPILSILEYLNLKVRPNGIRLHEELLKTPPRLTQKNIETGVKVQNIVRECIGNFGSPLFPFVEKLKGLQPYEHMVDSLDLSELDLWWNRSPQPTSESNAAPSQKLAIIGQHLRFITKLNLSQCSIGCKPEDEEFFKKIAQIFPKLEYLDLSRNLIKDSWLNYFERPPHLHTLNLSLCHEISYIGIRALQIKHPDLWIEHEDTTPYSPLGSPLFSEAGFDFDESKRPE